MRCSRLATLIAFAILQVLPASSLANVWVMTHITHRGNEGTLDQVGSISIGSTPNWTVLTEWSVGAEPKKLNELGIGGYHLDSAAVKADRSEVIGMYMGEDRKAHWIVYNFERMQKESKVTTLAPPPGFEVVDVQYIDSRVTMLSRRGDAEFECDQMPDEGTKWKRLFATTDGNLLQLPGFPFATFGVDAMQVAGKLPFVDVKRATPKTDFKWWEFFGPHGSSDLAAFEPKSGIVVVRSNWAGDVLEIARATPSKQLPTLKLEKPGFVRQIWVIDGITYIAKGDNTIVAYDSAGKLVCTLHGNLIAAP